MSIATYEKKIAKHIDGMANAETRDTLLWHSARIKHPLQMMYWDETAMSARGATPRTNELRTLVDNTFRAALDAINLASDIRIARARCLEEAKDNERAARKAKREYLRRMAMGGGR